MRSIVTTPKTVHIRRHGAAACGVQARRGVVFARKGLTPDFTRPVTCVKCLKLAKTHGALWAAQDAAHEAEQAREGALQEVERYVTAAISSGLGVAIFPAGVAIMPDASKGLENLVDILRGTQFRALWSAAVHADATLETAKRVLDAEASKLGY